MAIREDEGLPPSTYAAQIVQNLEGAKARPQLSGNRPQLRDLFRKVLDLDEIGAVDDETFERNLEINHKLIWTIVKGCLLVHSDENPFDNHGDVIEQAEHGLAVIEVTIRRTPAVLLLMVPDDAGYARDEGPLFIWLTPCLFSLLHLDHRKTLRDGAQKVLQTMLAAQPQVYGDKSSTQPILHYISDCLEDLLAYLLATQVSRASKQSFRLPVIPSADTVAGVSASRSFQTHSRVEADNAMQASSIFLSGVLTMLEATRSAASNNMVSNARLISDDLLSLRAVLTVPETNELDELWAQFLGVVDTTLKSLLSSDRASVHVNLLLHLSCQTTADILQSSIRIATYIPRPGLQVAICHTWCTLCSCLVGHPSAWRSSKQWLETTMHGLFLDERLREKYEAETQAVLCVASQLLFGKTDSLHTANINACSSDIQARLHDLLANTLSIGDADLIGSPPPKRQRASNSSSSNSAVEHDFRTTYFEAINLPINSWTSLPRIIPFVFGTPARNHANYHSDTFKELPENVQCDLIVQLGDLTCKLANCLTNKRCRICDEDQIAREDAALEQDEATILGNIFISVVQVIQQQRTPQPRVSAMLALRRYFAHCRSTEYMDLKNSTLAIWPVQSFKSSLRSLRIASIATMLQLICNQIPLTQLRANRRHVLDALRSLSGKDLTLQEISILGHGRIASIIQSEEELNLCLLRLIEYLGHSNPFVTNLAYEELQRLCSNNSNTAMRLFEPYWRTLAITIVKDLQTRPQICQTVCDILGIGISSFLKMTQFHTIPYLIVQKQQVILDRIAEANGSNANLLEICIANDQLAVILANILTQPSQDPEAMIVSLLSQISAVDLDAHEMLRTDPTRIAFELLQIASGTDSEDKSRARWGLGVLADHIQKKPSKKYSTVDMFFEENSLGIMQSISAIVSQIRGSHSISDRRRCVGAVEQMALIAGHHLLNALPQISSCLRSAIEDGDLCNEAFGAWITLMNSIASEDEVLALIDPTFAIVAQYWDSFSTEVQQSAHDLVDSLIRTRSEWFHEFVLGIPSLEGIPLLAKFENQLSGFKENSDTRFRLEAFAERCQSDNITVVAQALNELPSYLLKQQHRIHKFVASEQQDPILGYLIKSLLDVCVRLADVKIDLANDAARCLGLIGCVDPTKVDLPQETRVIFVLSDFQNVEETVEFVIFFLEEVLVKTFLAETDTRIQGLLAYAIQELLKACGFEPKNTINKGLQPDNMYSRWRAMDPTVRDVLTPFLNSRYSLEPLTNLSESNYPIYSAGMNHSNWLRQLVFDLLGKSVGQNTTLIFSICRRIVRRQNVSISAFLLPFASLHVIFQGTNQQMQQLKQEFLGILSLPLPTEQTANESLILCSQDVFRTLDYLSRWLQERKKTKLYHPRVGVSSIEEAQAQETAKLRSVEEFLDSMPAEIISRRAVQCKSFSRALMHWEAFIRQRQEEENISRDDMDTMYSKLQDIYNSIDEPDGIEGISSRIIHNTTQQQMLEHRKAGRWSALQSWYELELNKHPSHENTQLEFLRSLKESGQHDTLLNDYASMKVTDAGSVPLTELIAESAWATGRWDVLESSLAKLASDHDLEFDTGIAKILLMLRGDNPEQPKTLLDKLRSNVVRQLSGTNSKTLQSCHGVMFRLHILSEVEELSRFAQSQSENPESSILIEALPQRVEYLAMFPSQQQKLLSLQRALVQVARLDPQQCQVSTSWLMTAKLARKSGFTGQAFNAIFNASDLNDKAASIEDARLLWREGHHIKAIQNLKTAIDGGSFGLPGAKEVKEANFNKSAPTNVARNPVASRAHLLLAKWIDHAGQSQSEAIIEQYRIATALNNRTEKGHYHLGRHYNKLLESEKAKDPAKQTQSFITGEMAKLVIENYLRAMTFGAKYLHETLPRVLTLWLELGIDVKKTIDPKYGNDAEFRRHADSQRQRIFKVAMGSVKKYVDRLPAYIFYTAFPQVIARICHPHESVQSALVDVVAKVTGAHPQQAMWSLLALTKSKKQVDRLQRGKECWAKVSENAKRSSNETERSEIINLMRSGQRLSEQLLSLSNKDLGKRHGNVSLANDLGFNHSKSSHCRLAIPVEAMLTATLPSPKEVLRYHKAFPKETVTIDTFLDEVLVLNSLIKPKKVNIRGSDGQVYGILCKPKDDLRKDQRLLEFNSMITRLLKRDPQSSKRRLYIKTYAVTPLNEECGLIEWVDGVKPLRDILLDIYKLRNVKPDYGSIRDILDSITANKDQADRFYTEVLTGFPPVFHEWFTEMFPEPDAWFDARLRYTRSCAVMSMVGHVLGLGDRHGENILFQGQNGGTLHVDFNCLFDKGLTFEKPERVPFRLTHNMVDAFGVYGYEGPFRKCCELALGILRQNEHALMTILETFVHDPTTDFIGKKRKANPIVPDTPEGVLEAIRTKVRGLIPGESVPLSVEGHVQLLIQEATDAYNLAAMYIGWCPFL